MNEVVRTGEASDLIADSFEEIALVIGGLVAVHQVDDDFIWRLVRSLDAIRRKMLRRLEGQETEAGPSRGREVAPHAAIENFLLLVREG